MFNWLKKSKKKAESTSPEQVTDNKEIDNQDIESQLTEDQTTAVEVTQEQVTEEQVTEEQVTEEQVTEEQATEEQATEEQITDEQATEEQATEEQVTEEQVTEEQATEEQVTEEQATEDLATKEQPADNIRKDTTEKKKGLFTRLKEKLSRTRSQLGDGFKTLLVGKSIDDDLYEELETQLLLADLGMKTTQQVMQTLIKQATHKQLKDGEALAEVLKEQLSEILMPVSQKLDTTTKDDETGKIPFIILIIGVNGVGKTTTIGKLAKQFQAAGKSVMLAAGDTFRAAAVEQLEVWGERNDIPVVSQYTGADSASVIFDAVASAKAKNIDILIADTAGRLQNKDNLIEELKKVVRVLKKQIPDAPHEIMLTLDASTGQNALSQTKVFNEAIGVTGINLTKLDGTAKGGVIFALANEFGIPVRYIGVGEGIEDLREFSAEEFVEALFD